MLPTYRDPNDTSPTAAPIYGSTPAVASDKEDGEGFNGRGESAVMLENSFDTNTQVDGVDEADVIKANKD